MPRHPSRHPFRAVAVLLAAAGLLTACGGATGATGAADDEPILVGQTSVLDDTDPMNDPWALTSAGISETVFSLDRDGALQSRFVDDVTRVDDLHWTMQVKDGVAFADGTPVDAEALAGSLDAVQQGNELSNATAGVIDFEADGDTVDVTTTRPTAVLPSVLTEWTNVVFKQGDDGPVFTGPYEVARLDPGVRLDLQPNPHYPDADRRDDVGVVAYADVDAMRQALQSGAVDMAFTVTPDVAGQLEDEPGTHVTTFDAGYQYMGLVNTKSPVLGDLAVRQALDLGLDREQYVQALRGGQVAGGLFAHYFSFAGADTPTYDPAAAGAALDAAGWVPGADGVRVKDGQRLQLSLVTYASRPDLSTIMQIMVSQLADLGVDASTEVVDDIRGRLQSGDYDLALWAQHTAPTGEPSYFLNQFFRTGAGNNMTGYSSTTTDGLLDQLGTLEPGAERDAVAVDVQRQLHTDLPVLFLVDPQWHVAVDDRLADYRPYNGDYYVVDPELGLSGS